MIVPVVTRYEEELKIWRSGGTVSEADRVHLNASDAGVAALPPEEREALQQAAAVGEGGGGGLSEEERENFMRQESELLDLLDDKVLQSPLSDRSTPTLFSAISSRSRAHPSSCSLRVYSQVHPLFG